MKHLSLRNPWHKWVGGLLGVSVLLLGSSWGVTYAGKIKYQYDDAGRLKKVTYPDSSAKDYTLDPAGNRTKVQALDTQPPSTPAGLSVTLASPTQANLSWNNNVTDNVGVTGYRIYRNGAFYLNINSTVTTYSDIGIANGTAYSYAVSALDAAGNESLLSSAVTPAATLPPSVPTGLAATAASYSQVNLSWNAATAYTGSTVTAYFIYRDGVSVGSSAGLSFNDPGLVASTTYAYRVLARDSNLLLSALSATATVTTPAAPVVPPATPTWTAYAQCTDTNNPCAISGDLVLTWSAVALATRYELERSTATIPDGVHLVQGPYEARYSGVSTTYTEVAGTRGFVDAFRMRACNASGCSAYSTGLFFTVPIVVTLPILPF